MALLWSLARTSPSDVLEANFRPHSEYERRTLASIIEVYCTCGPKEATQRVRARAQRPGHRATHSLNELSPQLLAEYDRPIGVGPVVEADRVEKWTSSSSGRPSSSSGVPESSARMFDEKPVTPGVRPLPASSSAILGTNGNAPSDAEPDVPRLCFAEVRHHRADANRQRGRPPPYQAAGGEHL